MFTILDLIPNVMGLPAINENLEALLAHMAQHPAKLGLGIIMSWAKMIGLCIALGVGANECFQMMLGRRGIDVMKIIHIVIISICITFAGSIADIAVQPGRALGELAKTQADSQNDIVKAKEAEVAALQEQYLNKVREHLRQLEENKEAENAAKEEGYIERVVNSVNELKESIQNRIKEMTLLVETKLCEWINLIIRYIGEILFQVAYYGILVCHAIFLHILAAFAPLMFALSLSPHFKSAWSQWLSKYISISLWPFVTYIILFYVGHIMEFTLNGDVTSYETFLGDVDKDTEGNANIAAVGMQAIGTTCMYVVGLLVGVRAIAFVPEVASWLIPGGVSSGAGASSAAMGSAAGGMVMAAPGMALGAASGAAGAVSSVAGAAGSAANFGARVVGTMSHVSRDGSSAGLVSAIAQNTGLGKAYDEGRKRGRSGSTDEYPNKGYTPNYPNH